MLAVVVCVLCIGASRRICRICGHDFTEWAYSDDTSCLQNRTCKRDGYQEQREFHALDPWVYEDITTCWQVRTCKRGDYQECRKLHDYGEWEYDTPNTCWQTRTCRRDGHQEQRELHQVFGPWAAQEGEPYDVYEYGAQGQEKWTWDERVCLRCGYTEEQNRQKWWR